MTLFSQFKPNTWLISYTIPENLAKYINLSTQYGRKSLCCSGLQQTQKQRSRTGFACKSNRQNERSLCSVHFEENCFTRAFDPTQLRQLKPGSLPSIWGRKEPFTEKESTRQRRTKEKERQKVSA